MGWFSSVIFAHFKFVALVSGDESFIMGDDATSSLHSSDCMIGGVDDDDDVDDGDDGT